MSDKVEEKSAEQKINDILGVKGDGIEYKTKRGHSVKILPCSLRKLPKLYKLIEEAQAESKNGTLSEMYAVKCASVIKMALEETIKDITEDNVLDNFTISDFPKIFSIVLDLNDFFAGMREINAKASVMTK